MKELNRIAVSGLLALVCMGCSSKKDADTSRLVPISFDVSIVDGVQTKTPGVSGSKFLFDSYRYNTSNGRSEYNFAVWICDRGTSRQHMAGLANMSCMYYAYQDDSKSYLNVPASYMKSKTPIDVIAYYPRISNNSDPHSVAFDTKNQYDWMCYFHSYDAAETDVDNLPVAINFRHIMTCVEVWIKCKYSTQASVSKITLYDKTGEKTLVASGIFDAETGALSNLSMTNSITITGNNTGNNQLSEGSWQKYSFIMPEYTGFTGTNLAFKFTFNSDVEGRKEYVLSNTLTDADVQPVVIDGFETGKRYIYELSLDNTLLIEPLRMYEQQWVTVEKTYTM